MEWNHLLELIPLINGIRVNLLELIKHDDNMYTDYEQRNNRIVT